MFRPAPVLLLAHLATTAALAWGPHPEITQAALDALPPDAALLSHQVLGPDARRLTEYVWMADQRKQLIVRGDEVYYTDDYLLFPAATKHFQHICPEVKETYAPYFRRALQALRTESPRHAARWVGSLLHFTTDTGSPPHALGILGPVHSKMENWVDARLIHIPEYHPQMLGADDASAEAGFLKRMDGLIAYSKVRAERCRSDVEAERRQAVEPVVLECALETARVTADLLYTLGALAMKPPSGGALRGYVLMDNTGMGRLSRLPAKVILQDTLYSTLTEPDGSFEFRNLPPGTYQLQVSAPGKATPPQPVQVTDATVTNADPVDLMQGSTGNLIRNSTFSLHWLAPARCDHWSQPKRPAKLLGYSPMRDWEGEWVPLTDGLAYELSITGGDKAGLSNEPVILLRTKSKPGADAPVTESLLVAGAARTTRIDGSAEAAWVQICIRASKTLPEVLDAVSLRAVP